MPALPILTYHRILSGYPDKAADPQRISVSQEQFRRHCALLRRLGYRTVPLLPYVRQLRAGRPPAARTIALTFDDGYEDVWTLGAPVLREFGFTATLFAVPGELGGTNTWDDGQARLMTADQLRDWVKAGHEIGAHTCHHRHLTRVSTDEARREMEDSRKQLEDVLGYAVPLLAYPYGETSTRVGELARDAGFEAAFATDHAPRDHAKDYYWMRRAVIFPGNSLWHIFCKAQRWYPAYQDWKRRGKRA